jgi:hypothetical protein
MWDFDDHIYDLRNAETAPGSDRDSCVDVPASCGQPHSSCGGSRKRMKMSEASQKNRL